MKLFFLQVFLIVFTIHSASGKVILIDPGHGGDERGAISTGKGKGVVLEKGLALKVSRAIKTKLAPYHQVYLTRSYDRTVSLEKRAIMAQKVGADIFISVHANSSESKQSNGFETYYLDNVKDEAVKKVVRIENQGAKDVDGNDLSENPILQQILAELVVGQTVPLSKKLSSNIHHHLSDSLVKKFDMFDRGVKPGLFYVLAMSKVPGILLEVGFLSNDGDLAKIRSKKFIESYSTSVANGVIDYFKN